MTTARASVSEVKNEGLCSSPSLPFLVRFTFTSVKAKIGTKRELSRL
jgi:hypothetical protein